MPIRVTCPKCGKTVKAGDDWAGKRASCPSCAAEIDVPAAELQAPPPPRLERGHVADAPSVNVHLPKRSSSVGIVSTVLGVLGFMLCWVPLIGILTIPISGLGLLLGGLGFIVALVRRGSGIGWPVAGVVVSGLALFIGGSQVAVIGAAVEAVDQAAKAHSRTNQTIVPTYQSSTGTYGDGDADSETTTDNLNEPDAGSNPTSESPPSTAPDSEAAAEPQPEWASAEQAVRQGDVQVKVLRVSKENTPLKSFKGETTSKDKLLSVYLEIKNLGSSKKLNYQGWQGGDFVFGRDFASLNDNFGNVYKRINFGVMTKVIGQLEADSIYPGDSVTDVLVFEPPIKTAEHLDLELPADNFGGEGMLRIRIPRTMFGGPDPAQIAAKRAEREAREREKRVKEEADRKAEEARLAAIEEAKYRTWTAASGGHTTEAKAITYTNGQVTLEKRDGKQTRVPVDKLSDADQEYIEQWRREKR